ncbi:hypothetical protein BDN72DRAFT_901605 [Pluteus cervinus]|uniref:Uncharacterized protein n=1 Tax=Pluteus cervinus TaxID=181527 RepID=A0ACD3AHS0_9AGAR|nr:hypothetical protein BDN72DRAFT_901605 [Pluteus cervinus]
MAPMSLEDVNGMPPTTGIEPRSNAPDVPIELLQLILEAYYPTYVQSHVRGVAEWDKRCWNRRYFESIHTIARFRLVNWTWYNSITPHLYSTIVIFCTSEQSLKKWLEAIAYHPRLIRNLVFRGYHNLMNKETINLRTRIFAYLASCFAECTNLQQLELADMHFIIGNLSKGSIHRIFKEITLSPLSSLSIYTSAPWTVSSMKSLSNSLRGLSIGNAIQGLRELEIYGTLNDSETQFAPNTFPVPSEMPSLERIVIRALPSWIIQKILSRAYCKQHPSSTTHSTGRFYPLRHLSITHVTEYWEISTLVDSLASSGVGTHLTSLRLYYLQSHSYIHASEIDAFPFSICGVCPRLKEFLYYLPCTERWLSGIPPNIEVLGLFVANQPVLKELRRNAISEYNAFIEFVQDKERRRGVRKVCVRWEYGGQREDDVDVVQVANASLKAGIAFELGRL